MQLTFVASLTKILGELVCVESGAHENDFEVISEVEQVPHDDEQHVRLQASLVNFVQHKVTDAGQEPVVQKYCKKKNVDFRSADVMNPQFDALDA